jgi:putative transposase
MSAEAVGMDVRVLVAAWPPDAPRGAVSRFCREHDVSRSWFYEVRARVAAEGVDGLQRRPRPRPATAVPAEVEDIAVRVRKELADAGLDNGPVSVRDKMLQLGVAAPSRATLARLLARRGMVVAQPQKRPRSSWRRFEAAQVHHRWQLDSFAWPLAGGEAAVVFQMLDDRSRALVASRAASGETSEDAVAVFTTAVADFQVPCELLTDNGTALNPWRRGVLGQLAAHAQQLGVRTITGRVRHPQTQGKDERVHATTQKWLRAQVRAATLAELQDQLDRFDSIYNFRRGHQALGLDPSTGWLRTPAQALADGPLAEPPQPPSPEPPPSAVAGPGPLRARRARVSDKGKIAVAGKHIQVGAERIGQTLPVVVDGSTVTVFDEHGQLIATVHTVPGVHYYGNGKPRGRRPKTRRDPEHPQQRTHTPQNRPD